MAEEAVALSLLRPLALTVNSRQQDNVEAYPSDSKGRVVCRPCLFNADFRLGFLELYYTYSPAMADFITKHTTLRTVARWTLLPLVGVSWVTLELGPVPSLALILLLGSGLGGIVGFSWRKVKK